MFLLGRCLYVSCRLYMAHICVPGLLLGLTGLKQVLHCFHVSVHIIGSYRYQLKLLTCYDSS